MNRLSLKLIVGLALVVCLAATAFAQQTPRVQLIVRDNGTGLDTLTFGYDRTATRCIDPSLGEQELPPAPPTGVFDARWGDPAAVNECMGQGLKINWHYWDNVAYFDTLKVQFQASEAGFPFHFSWPAGLNTIFSSLALKDPFNFGIVNVDMLANTSYDLTNSAFTNLLIYATPIIYGVIKEGNLVPEKFELQQNYPNPFNPTTTVKFSIEKTAMAQVAVYDILGRQISTLVNEQLTPGFYNVTWNGTDASGNTVGTGVYYIRMTANVQGDEAFSSVRKIMMMK
jgi:hypothetical protein